MLHLAPDCNVAAWLFKVPCDTFLGPKQRSNQLRVWYCVLHLCFPQQLSFAQLHLFFSRTAWLWVKQKAFPQM